MRERAGLRDQLSVLTIVMKNKLGKPLEMTSQKCQTQHNNTPTPCQAVYQRPNMWRVGERQEEEGAREGGLWTLVRRKIQMQETPSVSGECGRKL